jgi:hypothetical protein
MKFCKDCKWKDGGYYCQHRSFGLDMVTGKQLNKELRYARASKQLCGPTAKWFEEKEKPIPKCEECKYLETGYLMCLATNSFLASISNCRLNEYLCGKYGKWFEKKEQLPPGTLVPIPVTNVTKKQSRLCRLICGRK